MLVGLALPFALLVEDDMMPLPLVPGQGRVRVPFTDGRHWNKSQVETELDELSFRHGPARHQDREMHTRLDVQMHGCVMNV